MRALGRDQPSHVLVLLLGKSSTSFVWKEFLGRMNWPMTALESCCLLKMLDQYSHVPSSYDRQGSNGVEIHSQVPNVHILENDKDEVSHHAHACRGLLFHDVTSTQWTRKVLQHKTEPCSGMASGGSPGAYYVDGLVTWGSLHSSGNSHS